MAAGFVNRSLAGMAAAAARQSLTGWLPALQAGSRQGGRLASQAGGRQGGRLASQAGGRQGERLLSALLLAGFPLRLEPSAWLNPLAQVFLKNACDASISIGYIQVFGSLNGIKTPKTCECRVYWRTETGFFVPDEGPAMLTGICP